MSIDVVIEYLLFLRPTHWMGLLLYWLPAATCVVLYTIKTIEGYRKDLERRSRMGKDYYPTLMVGHIIGRMFASVIPVVNIFASAVDLAPEYLSQFFSWLGRFFDKPLVRRREEEQK